MLPPRRPSRMQILPLSPISGANPRDGPAAARLRLADWRTRRNPAGSDPRIGLNPRAASSGPLRARRHRSRAADRRFSAIADAVALADRVLVPNRKEMRWPSRRENGVVTSHRSKRPAAGALRPSEGLGACPLPSLLLDQGVGSALSFGQRLGASREAWPLFITTN